ncbi:RHS repeat-associated core domain-containing protein [Cyanobacterium aponinum UTEX 3222]|nr:RHS repeat-associated core domain-containing protein [Cyanobacterium aponinum UTEX 3222]
MRYLHGNQVDEVLAQEDGNGDVVWLLRDYLGTIRDLLDNTGDVVNHLTYDSYGNVVSETNSAVDSRYRFTGREWDEEIDLYYYRARYYSGESGRFTSVDPISFESGTYNLYGYVDNNPINSIDSSGLLKVELHYRPTPLNFHADIVVTDKLESRVYWAGPEKKVFQGGLISTLKGFFLYNSAGKIVSQGAKFDQSYIFYDLIDLSKGETVYDDGTDCPNLLIKTSIAIAFLNAQRLNIVYHPLGPNSNSVARYALSQAGIIERGFQPKQKPLPGWSSALVNKYYPN